MKRKSEKKRGKKSKVSAPAKRRKLPYEKPVLKEFGTLQEMLGGRSGMDEDMGTSKVGVV